jgi:hypothetical protein
MGLELYLFCGLGCDLGCTGQSEIITIHGVNAMVQQSSPIHNAVPKHERPPVPVLLLDLWRDLQRSANFFDVGVSECLWRSVISCFDGLSKEYQSILFEEWMVLLISLPEQ